MSKVRYCCSANPVSVSNESFHVFVYEMEYYLKGTSEHVTTKGEGWHKVGSIFVSTPVTRPWEIQHLFKRWTGDSTEDSATKGTVPLTLNCPRCRSQTIYVERIKRHYCTQCKKYL